MIWPFHNPATQDEKQRSLATRPSCAQATTNQQRCTNSRNSATPALGAASPLMVSCRGQSLLLIIPQPLPAHTAARNPA